MRIAIVSNTEHSIPLLQFLVGNNLRPLVYIASSRYVASTEKLLAFCRHAKIEHVQETAQKNAFNDWAKKARPELMIVMGFSQKIDLSAIPVPSKGIYNVHFGKLPAYRGPAPLFWQLKNGEEKLGLAIHVLTNKFDQGNIVWDMSITNEAHFNYPFVQQLFGNLTVNGVASMLQLLQLTGTVPNRPQQPELASYYPSPAAKDVWVYWDSMEAAAIVHLIKACNDWNVGALSLLDGNWEIKIIDAEAVDAEPSNAQPGTIHHIDNHAFYIKCSGAALLKVYSITVNNVLVPARHAARFGLAAGMRFKTTFQTGA